MPFELKLAHDFGLYKLGGHKHSSLFCSSVSDKERCILWRCHQVLGNISVLLGNALQASLVQLVLAQGHHHNVAGGGGLAAVDTEIDNNVLNGATT
jgi:hypothetical protein